MKRSWIAKEDIDMDLPTVDESVGEIPSETVEAVYADIQAVDHEVEKLFEDGNELEADTEKMENLAEAAEDSLEEGGMDESTAAIAEVAAESYTRRWGVTYVKVGTENFGVDSRLNSTRFAVESYNVAAEGLGERFVDWFKALKEAIAKKWEAVSNYAVAVNKRVEKLKMQADSMTDAPAKLDATTHKDIIIDNTFDLKYIKDFLKTSGADLVKAGKDLVATYGEKGPYIQLETGEKKTQNQSGIKKVALIMFLGIFAVPFLHNGKEVNTSVVNLPKGATMVKATATFGNIIIYTYTKGDTVYTDFAVAEKPNLGEIPAADKKTVLELLEGVSNMANNVGPKVKEYIKAVSDIASLEKSLADAKTGVKDAKKADYEDKASKKDGVRNAKVNLSTAKSALKNIKTVSLIHSDVIVNGINGILKYLDSSIKAAKA